MLPISGVRMPGVDFWRELEGRRASSSMRSIGERGESMPCETDRGIALLLYIPSGSGECLR